MTESKDPKTIGTKIYNEIFERNNDVGAKVVELSSGQGGAKTSACLDMAEKTMSWYPSEKVFWRESIKSPVQFTKVIGYPYKIFVEEGYELIFKNVTKHIKINPEITVFSGFDELNRLAKGQTLNVVFFKSLFTWIDFIAFLISDEIATTEWQTIVMDEYEDIFPSGTSGEEWRKMQKGGDVIKHCRKGYVTLIGNCHKGRAIDWRIRDKVMIYMYGFGSRVDFSSRINQYCVDSTVTGDFWIDKEHSRFGYIHVDKIHKPPKESWTIIEV